MIIFIKEKSVSIDFSSYTIFLLFSIKSYISSNELLRIFI